MFMMYFIKHVSDTTAAIFMVMVVLQVYESPDLISCVVTP